VSAADRVALIAAVGALLASVVAALGAFLAAKTSKHNATAIQEVHLSLNSRLEELLKAAHFRGQIEERDNQRAVDQKTTQHSDAISAGQVKERDNQRAIEEQNLPPAI
jgi:hypothetical protein